MDKLLKPEQLCVDPNSFEVIKQRKHWVQSFENYSKSIEQARQDDHPINKLKILTNRVDFKIFDFIKSCNTHEAAIENLHNRFVKMPNAIFALHLLATAKQQLGQTCNELM